MTNLRDILSAGLIAALCLGAGAGITRAQATPTPDVPQPSLCTAPARPYDNIAAVMATPEAATPVAAATPSDTATPAPAGDAAAIAQVVRELIACFNAGEPLRAYGLYSDVYLRHLLTVQGVPNEAGYALWATPEPLPADRFVQILAIRDINRLANGRTRAVVTLRYTGVPVPKTFAFDFIETPAGWRIDALLGEINFSLP